MNDMDAVEFFNELNGMCKTYSTKYKCKDLCPLYEIESREDTIGLFVEMRNNPKNLVEIVEKWSKENS